MALAFMEKQQGKEGWALNSALWGEPKVTPVIMV